MKSIGVSVKNLVGTALRKGHIDSRYVSSGRAEEGSIVHRIIQKSYSGDDKAEVSLSHTWEKEDVMLIVGGRADGILSIYTDPTIEEIKSTNRKTEDISEPFETHLAQAKIYAYIYAVDNSLEKIKVKMTYYSMAEKISKYFMYEYTVGELEIFFNDICEKYFMYVRLKLSMSEDINRSIDACRFPFEYRKYQKQVISKIYSAQNDGKNIFICAPTGTGKTINAIFPSLKIYPSLKDGKIFYLTSKSTQKNVAMYNLSLLRDRGLKAVSVEITAKEKACRLESPSCNPDDCPYARDYYDKLWDVTNDILKNETLIDRNVMNIYAEKYTVCPFELSLDMSNWSDIIVCDYNYVFDPAAALKRYFEEKGGEYIFLVDEAHNLIGRSREMYSAELSKRDILSASNKVKSNKKLNPVLRKINAKLTEYKKASEEDGILMLDGVDEYLVSLLYKFQSEADRFLSEESASDGYEDIYDLYFDTVAFLRIYDLMGDSHTVYYDAQEESLILFCTDAKEYLAERLKNAKSSVFFSATLSPLSYYCELLGGRPDDRLLNVPSSFDKDKFEITADLSVKTTYAHRNQYYGVIATKIYNIISEKAANYMVFFPSYDFMYCVYELYGQTYPTDNIILTERGLTESAREDIIASMTPEAHVTLFAVSGGVFSEGIDLTGEKLYGAIIVGCALPMVSVRNELIREHFENNGRDGFEYAYIIPAMNKVLQSMGRVIRTADDEGMAYLMDERFVHAKYKRCFPPHYDHIRFIK